MVRGLVLMYKITQNLRASLHQMVGIEKWKDEKNFSDISELCQAWLKPLTRRFMWNEWKHLHRFPITTMNKKNCELLISYLRVFGSRMSGRGYTCKNFSVLVNCPLCGNKNGWCGEGGERFSISEISAPLHLWHRKKRKWPIMSHSMPTRPMVFPHHFRSAS